LKQQNLHQLEKENESQQKVLRSRKIYASSCSSHAQHRDPGAENSSGPHAAGSQVESRVEALASRLLSAQQRCAMSTQKKQGKGTIRSSSNSKIP
jgi:hypothetical protein